MTRVFRASLERNLVYFILNVFGFVFSKTFERSQMLTTVRSCWLLGTYLTAQATHGVEMHQDGKQEVGIEILLSKHNSLFSPDFIKILKSKQLILHDPSLNSFSYQQ